MGDNSRIFVSKKKSSAVLMQQGRVLLDADWNEQYNIQHYRNVTEAKDIIGNSGVPKKNGGFMITAAPGGFIISPGRIYVEGLLCELDQSDTATTYFNQPYYPNPDASFFTLESPVSGSFLSPPDTGLNDGTYIIYLEAWQREINFRDDSLIQEKALGEADTTTRLQNVWQVKLLKVPDDASATCKTSFQEWADLINPPSGKLNARTQTIVGPQQPCVLPPSAGYRRLENQLYRVEIHQAGDMDTATFKWSRDNAMVETTIEQISGNILKVSEVGKDDVLSFASEQWVEIVDEESCLKNNPNPLVQIDTVNPETREIILKTSAAQYTGLSNLKLRRWDQDGAQATETGIPVNINPGGWIDLEDGIQVQFSGVQRSGNHWPIAARTATGEIEWPPFEIPNLNPVEQSPIGINRYFCKLAVLNVQAGTALLTDCRKLFPSLTELSAEDIWYDNNNCDLAAADNVQEALDLLCAANDLRKHNKLLHGHGVICGLKIICCVDCDCRGNMNFTSIANNQIPDRQCVAIENGHALDCEGNIIEVKLERPFPYNIVAESEKKGFLDEKHDGVVCLKIVGTNNKQPILVVEKYVKQSFWDEILEGTLIKDFYDDCIKKLIDFLKVQLSFSITEEVPVSLQQRKMTTLINLFSQLVNSASGPFAFLSGAKNENRIDCSKSTKGRNEDNLLWCFYKDLKAAISSETFCAMNDNDHAFPDYNIDPGLETIFGPPMKLHNVIKLHPSGKFAYTCGTNNKIYVYNISDKELIQSIAFPANNKIKIQDIVISAEGDTIYAVGLLDNNKDSIFAAGIIDSKGIIEWKNTSVHCAMNYIKLGLSGVKLYASAQNKGLYEIIGIGTQNFTQNKIIDCNATGLFLISEDGLNAFIAVADGAAVSTNFNHVENYQINGNGVAPQKIGVCDITGRDAGNDMLLLPGNFICISGTKAGTPSQQIVARFRRNTSTTQPPDAIIEIESSSFIRLSLAKKFKKLLITFSDKCKVLFADVSDFTLEHKLRIPVQLFPVSIQIDEKSEKAYVLNTFVDTITEMDLLVVFKNGAPPNFMYDPPYDIANYRDAVILAYKDVLSHLLQSLKDCFCDKFLIDCPTCNEKDSVYLGCITIKEGRVYHICNFTKRKYVKSFPAVEYWLSTVPILPIFKKAFDKFCCSIL